MKQSFEFGGMHLVVQKSHLTPKIRQALRSGMYENAERRAIAAHVRGHDRVLDLGAGIGCTGIVAGRVVGGDRLVVVEANGDLLSDISDNLMANGIFGATIIHGAVVAAGAGATAGFYKSKGFWAGSLVAGHAPRATRIEVGSVYLAALLQEFTPSVIICDTEGVEAEIFNIDLPEHLRLIILELHPNIYDQAGIKAIFDRLSTLGFSYLTTGSRGKVVCFGR